MKVTKYSKRYTISLSENEWLALQELVRHGKADFADVDQLAALDPPIRNLIRSDRWSAIDGPLTVDEEKAGRGGYARAEARP